jgi:TonB family protein
VVAARIRIVARLGGAGSQLSPFILASLCGHVIFAAALILVPSLRPRKPFPDNPIVVDLVAAPRAAAQVQAPPAAPEDAPPEGVRLETREPPKVTPLPEKPKKKKVEKPPPPPQPARPAPADQGGPAPGEAAGIVGELGGGALASPGSDDFQFAWYRDSITAAFRSQWRRPILSGQAEPIEVRLSFEILRDGSVRDLRVDQSSGLAIFDRAALRAVTDAAPLPPLPGAWREPTLHATWVFRMFPD